MIIFRTTPEKSKKYIFIWTECSITYRIWFSVVQNSHNRKHNLDNQTTDFQTNTLGGWKMISEACRSRQG